MALVEPVEVALVLRDDLRLERPVAIARDAHLDGALIRPHRLAASAVATIRLARHRRLPGLVAEVVAELRFPRAAHQRGRQLLQQAIRADEVLGRLVVPQQLVEELRPDPRALGRSFGGLGEIEPFFFFFLSSVIRVSSGQRTVRPNTKFQTLPP